MICRAWPSAWTFAASEHNHLNVALHSCSWQGQGRPQHQQHLPVHPRHWRRPALKQDREDREAFAAKDFNLALAATLGACSFESYNPPYRMYGVKELDDNQSETVYMDRKFLDQVMAGILQVHVRRAENLSRPKNEKGQEVALHPQIMVSVGPSCGWSTVKSCTTDPVYGETKFLYVRNPPSEPLCVSLRHCTSRPDQKAGELARLELPDITSLCDGAYHELEAELEGEDGFTGTVFLAVEFLKHSEEDDSLGELGVRAAGQMMSDDWGWPVPEQDWYADPDYEWRSNLVTTDQPPIIELTDEGLDITGLPAGTGEPLGRPPWDMWKTLRQAIITRKLTSSFEPFAFLANVASDTEAWLFVSDSQEAVIAFRGTSAPADMAKDALCDLAAFSPGDRPTSKQPEEVAEEVPDDDLKEGPMGGILKFAEAVDAIPFVPQIGRLIAKVSNLSGRGSTVQGKPPLSGWAKAQTLMVYSTEHDERWVHNGFLQSYMAVRNPMLRLLDEMMSLGDESKSWHIYLTGHSMGGALATLAAYELASLEYTRVPKPAITVYTYGSPRVGNIPFAEDYDKQVPDTWRIANENDIVPKIPSLLGYRHVGHEVVLASDGNVSVAEVSSDQIREGAMLSDITPRIKEGLFGSDKKLKLEFKELMNGEWQLAQTILRGKAVAEHMEDKYHDMLKACVEAGGEECQPNFGEVEESMQPA